MSDSADKVSTPELPAPPRTRGRGVQTVYEALRRAIVDLRLEPGSPLDEVTLAERFDMSRTPVREALVRLAAEGLVTQLPNRNTIVAPIDFAGQFPGEARKPASCVFQSHSPPPRSSCTSVCTRGPRSGCEGDAASVAVISRDTGRMRDAK